DRAPLFANAPAGILISAPSSDRLAGAPAVTNVKTGATSSVSRVGLKAAMRMFGATPALSAAAVCITRQRADGTAVTRAIRPPAPGLVRPSQETAKSMRPRRRRCLHRNVARCELGRLMRRMPISHVGLLKKHEALHAQMHR